MTGHIHAELMKQYANDAATYKRPWELWECRGSCDYWEGLENNPHWYTDQQYRRKQKTININGFEIPEPLRIKPETGAIYFFPCFERSEHFKSLVWKDDRIDNITLSHGVCHFTKEAAIAHAEALLSFTQIKD